MEKTQGQRAAIVIIDGNLEHGALAKTAFNGLDAAFNLGGATVAELADGSEAGAILVLAREQ